MSKVTTEREIELGTAPCCPICGAADAGFEFAKDGYRHFSCQGCGLLFMHPVPSAAELAALYQAPGGDPNSSMCWAGTREHMFPLWRRVLKSIERRGGRGRILDVGCGGGQFLALARSCGWTDLLGIEISPLAAAAARRTSGAEILGCDFLDAQIPPGSMAAVAIWDVIEHLSDPRAVIRRAREVLRPGGSLVVSTVNRRGVTMRLLKSRAFIVMPPEHLAYYTGRALRQLLMDEGFRVHRLIANDVYIQDWVRFLGRPVRNDAGDRYRKGYGLLTGSHLLRGLRQAANLLLDAGGLGDELIGLASKPEGA